MKNICILKVQGYLGQDPEIKHTKSGKKYAVFTIATNRKWKDKATQEWQEEGVIWHKVVAWDDFADQVQRDFKKGSAVYISGEFKVSTWTDKEGQEKTSHRIELNQYVGQLLMVPPKVDQEEAKPGARFVGQDAIDLGRDPCWSGDYDKMPF